MAANALVGCFVFLVCCLDGVLADGLPTGAIIGISVGSFIFLKLIIVIVVSCKARARRREMERQAERIVQMRREHIERSRMNQSVLPTVTSGVMPPTAPQINPHMGGYTNPMGVSDFAPPPYSMQNPTAVPPGDHTMVMPFYPSDYPLPPSYDEIIDKEPESTSAHAHENDSSQGNDSSVEQSNNVNS